MSDRIRHFRGDPSGFAPHGMLSCLCQLALLRQHAALRALVRRVMVATLGASPHLLLPARKASSCTGVCPCSLATPSLQTHTRCPSLQGQNTGPEYAHRVNAWTRDEFVCTSSQVQAHVHEHKYSHTHTALEQMTQRFLWKDVKSI